ncbi:hypothetical protein Lqui_1768 [Legionella quinlivanii]|uniref:Ankyrin repeat protein n=1 Tax=Legionella quinlivanii TaxID=45073 RepID=A0A0W0Y0D6_9GAMM|nr:hypothetical protein [Legionella quinlivanii]KTD50443.1 hypothetical protein Lqui_1768 [Legionella quinlivanii]MCW8449804.1 hypothetical protein [Legionella quinlivanii]SEF40116.1 hypothetical protein SAMN02746093_00055 [Legionella quinlivanii DSM 21216]STY12043.1 Uncharacterised protein [Legionella quinlivanii]
MPSNFSEERYKALKSQAIEAIEQNNLQQLKELLNQSYKGLLPVLTRKGRVVTLSTREGMVPYLNTRHEKPFLRDLAIQQDHVDIVDFLFNDGMGIRTELNSVDLASDEVREKSYRERFLNKALEYNSRKVIDHLLTKGFSLSVDQLRLYARENNAEQYLNAVIPLLNKLPALAQKADSLHNREYYRESERVRSLDLFIRNQIKLYIDSCIALPEKSAEHLEKQLKSPCYPFTSSVKEELRNHRGYKEFFANLMITISTLFIANIYQAVATKGESFFFKFNTDSVNQLTEVQNSLYECSL